MFNKKLKEDLKKLSYVYEIEFIKTYFIARGFLLPPGYNLNEISILVLPPEDYPLSPPGVGSSYAYIPKGVLYQGYELQNVYPDLNYPGFGDWAWFCFRDIEWNPNKDDLIKFFELIRTTLTNQPVKKPVMKQDGFFEKLKKAFFG